MAVNTDIFLGSGASLTFVPEVDLCVTLDTSSTATSLVPDGLFTGRFLFVPNIYVGCILDLYNSGTSVPVSTHIITANTTGTITISPAADLSSGGPIGTSFADAADFAVIRSYGAPCVGAKDSTTIRLNADNWLGLVETGTFPNVDVEMKQLNLSLGSSRNWTHQYKGIKTASGGSVNLIANHGAWLYYALGQCTSITATISDATPDSAGYDAEVADDVYINTGSGASGETTFSSHTNTGPIFYRTNKGGQVLVPPVCKNLDTVSDLEQLTRTTSTATAVAQPITYTFKELNSEDLPSFALEQSIAKNSSSLLTEQYTVGGAAYNNETEIDHTASTLISVGDSVYGASGIPTGATVASITDDTTFELSVSTTAGLLTGQTLTFNPKSESNTFTRVARGNRVNTLTMTANENEEVKMTMDLNTRGVTDINQEVDSPNKYEARAGTETNTNLFNFASSSDAELLEPFFFSSGSFNVFGQQFLKITSLSLTINNNLMDKRFVGIGSKDIKSALPAQRSYELTFTALVTDDALFQELFTETEVASGTSTIDIQFDKADGEQILIKFQDYHLTASNWTIPDDKGAITVDATVMPRTLNSCTVKTHWVLQG
jgi:hypothetical protein